MMSAMARFEMRMQVTVRFFIRVKIVQMTNAFPGNPMMKAMERIAMPSLADIGNGAEVEFVIAALKMVVCSVTVYCQ